MERMYVDCSAELRRWARALARDASEADDLVQEAFVSALRNPDVAAMEPRAQLRWLKRAAKHRLIDIRRAEKLRRERMPVGSESYFDDLTYVEVAQALAGLEPAQREVVAMSALGGMTSVEIARSLGIPAPTVRTRLRAARLRLREMKRHGDV